VTKNLQQANLLKVQKKLDLIRENRFVIESSLATCFFFGDDEGSIIEVGRGGLEIFDGFLFEEAALETTATVLLGRQTKGFCDSSLDASLELSLLKL